MNIVETAVRHKTAITALAHRGITVDAEAAYGDFCVITGHAGPTQILGVVCPNTVLDALDSPARLRSLYQQLQKPDQFFLLIPEPGRERDAQDLLGLVLRVGVIPAPSPFPH